MLNSASLGWISFTIVSLIFPFVVGNVFWSNVAILCLIIAAASTGWNLIGGYTGQMSFGHALFFGAGAYTTALLVLGLKVSPWIGIAVGVPIAIALALLTGAAAFHLSGHNFAIATLALQQIAFAIVVNNQALGGSAGFAIPYAAPSLWSLQFRPDDRISPYFVALVLLAFNLIVVALVLRSRIGRYMVAVREDEIAAASLGVPVRRVKTVSLVISATLTALAGGIYVMYSVYVYPDTSLGVDQSILIALVAILGGSGSLAGPIVGAWILIALQETTRILFPTSLSGADYVTWGLLLILIGILEPDGVVGILKRLRMPIRTRQTDIDETQHLTSQRERNR